MKADRKNKLKVNLKLCINRINLMITKKKALTNGTKREVVSLIQQKKYEGVEVKVSIQDF